MPGPQFPLYLMGRRLQRIYPMVPLARRQAICFGIMSYDGQVNFGLTADYDTMGDVDALAADLEASIDELAEAAGAGAEATPRGQAGRGKAPPRATRPRAAAEKTSA